MGYATCHHNTPGIAEVGGRGYPFLQSWGSSASQASELGSAAVTTTTLAGEDGDDAGNMYACWSDNDNVYYAVSPSRGHTWSNRVRVNRDPDGATNTSIFPWIAGGEEGVLNVTWYASTAEDNTVDDATWHVYFSQARGALSDPAVTQARVTDHVVRTGPVCQGGAPAAQAAAS